MYLSPTCISVGENVAYALFDNSKNGDFKPYVYKSTNRGGSWTSISGDLPGNGPALAFAEDHVNPDLLFVGTEFGLFFTVYGGQKCTRLRSNVPTIPVRDLAIQERENDLVLATFGRGFYVLDDYSALREVTAGTLAEEARLFPLRHAYNFNTTGLNPAGSAGIGTLSGNFQMPNPPFGAVLTYHVKQGSSRTS